MSEELELSDWSNLYVTPGISLTLAEASPSKKYLLLPEALDTVTANSIIAVLSSKFIVLLVNVSVELSVTTVLSIEIAPEEKSIPVPPLK